MSKHTAQPWTIRQGDKLEIWGADGRKIIAEMTAEDTGAAERDANARLIIAAPALFAALRKLVDDSPYAFDGRDCECGYWEDQGDCPHCQAYRTLAFVTDN